MKHHYLIKKLFTVNLKNITDEDYIHPQILFEELKSKKYVCSKWCAIECRCI